MAQAKGYIHAAEGQFFNTVIDAVVFCSFGAQKLAPRWGIKKQITHLDTGTLRMGCRLQLNLHIAALRHGLPATTVPRIGG